MLASATAHRARATQWRWGSSRRIIRIDVRSSSPLSFILCPGRSFVATYNSIRYCEPTPCQTVTYVHIKYLQLLILSLPPIHVFLLWVVGSVLVVVSSASHKNHSIHCYFLRLKQFSQQSAQFIYFRNSSVTHDIIALVDVVVLLLLLLLPLLFILLLLLDQPQIYWLFAESC